MLVETFTGRTGEIVGRTPDDTPPEAARVFVRLTVRPGRREVPIVCRYHPDDVRPVYTAPLKGVQRG